MNLGILGLGKVADRHLAPAISSAHNAQLWSICGRESARARAFAQRHSVSSPFGIYTSIDAFLADPELHGVVIASPDLFHAEHATRAAAAGKHVLVEKPMTNDLKDGVDILNTARLANVQLGVGYQLRWHDGHRRLWYEVQNDCIGNILHARVQWTYVAPVDGHWRQSSKLSKWWALGAFGTHGIDLMRWFLLPTCGDIVRVSSLISNAILRSETDETAMVMLQFASGATAELTTSVHFNSPTRLEIYGDRGWAICEDTLGYAGNGKIFVSGKCFKFTVSNVFRSEIEDFVSAAITDRPCEVDGIEGLRNVELLLSAIGA
jgi:predicted dehydrogenase